jgi:hypothetical protein
MALSILDGNQSATTLSTIVSSGQHIPSHTVVSLGSQAISNITSAISGTSVCVGNLGLLQSTVGTEGITANTNFIKIGGHSGTSTTGNIVHVSSIGAMKVDGSSFTQPVSISSVTIGNTVTIAGTVTANPTGTQTIAGSVTIGAGTAQIGSVTASISGTVPVSGIFYQATQPVSLASVPTHGVTLTSTTVTVSSLPTISGSVTISALPRPTWTNYSGTVTTANTAVTAISTTTRSYLLAQVTTGQMFINIGATATTLNSVYFSAGQGFAWETSVPQGFVSIISAVTGTNYVLKEG